MSADIDWEVAPLKSRLLRIDAGRSPELPDTPAGAGEWGVLKVSSVHAEGFRPEENKLVTSSAFVEPRYEVFPGEVLFSRANTPELVGSSCLVTEHSQRLMLSDKTLRLVPDSKLADARFINLCLNSAVVRRQIERAASGSSRSMQNISQRSLERLTVRWPPVGEQREIAEIVESITALQRATERSIAKMHTLRNSAVAAEIPCEQSETSVQVSWIPVGEVGSVRMGKQLSPGSQRSTCQYPYLRVANVLDGRIDYSDVKSMGFTDSERRAYSLRPGDILLNEGQSLELVGRSAIYEGGLGKFYFQNTLLRFRSLESVLPRYAQAVFSLWLRVGKFAQVAKKTTSIAHLGGERFSALLFPVLPVAQQLRIVELIEAWDANISNEKRAWEKIKDLKRGLTDDLLAGKVRVGKLA